MILIKEYDLLNNKRIFISLNIFSVFLFFFFIFLFSMVGISVLGLDEFGFSINFEDLLYFLPFFLAGFFLVICIHELIHGSFSKLFNKEAHIRYGFKKGCPYVTAPGARYSRAQFTWICLAPFTFITLILLSAVSLGFIPINLFVNMASLHAAACVGDFYWVFLLSRHPGNILVEDTEQGMTVYLNN